MRRMYILYLLFICCCCWYWKCMCHLLLVLLHHFEVFKVLTSCHLPRLCVNKDEERVSK
ncbi:hypothetical protein HanXRQr2_Chr14g0626941 [Helianthus annuus]|uniref:Uncharacterized protein n=1 Tax=Helianthus annuus TaxID=4232 RepID=A0A9K3E609_HELAN|nr:hypothetical protein HanXRQr2_Chr14g0626941 [Helianthus annuus]